MKLRTSFLALLLAWIMVLAPLAARAGVELSPHEINTLARGELVIHPLPGSGANSVVAGSSFVVINAPPEVVWRALEDISAWKHIFPSTVGAKVVAARGETKAVKMRLGNAIITVDFYLTTNFNQEKMEFTFALNKKKPHDIDETRGWMRLIPQPGGKTIVAFSALVKTPFGALIKLIGKKVIHWIEHRMLMIPKRLKRWVEGPQGIKYKGWRRTSKVH